MATRTRKELEDRLKELKSNIVVKEDHNNADLEIFIAFEEQKLELAKPVASLPADLKTMENLTSTVKKQTEDIEDLNALLATAEARKGGKSSNPVGKFKKKTYEILYPKLRIGDKVVSAQEIADDQVLLGGLVNSGSSAVREVEQ